MLTFIQTDIPVVQDGIRRAKRERYIQNLQRFVAKMKASPQYAEEHQNDFRIEEARRLGIT